MEGVNGYFEGTLVNISGSGVGMVTVENVKCFALGGIVGTGISYVGGTTFALHNNFLNNVLSGASVNKNCTVIMRNNILGSAVNMTNGFIRGQSSNNPTITVMSGGGNDPRLTPALLWVIVNDSPTISFSGNCADLNIDLSATGVNRVQGAICK